MRKWVSQRIGHETSGGSGHTVSGLECPRSGGARSSVADGRRDVSGSPFSYRRSTREADAHRYPRQRRLGHRPDLERVLRQGKRVRTRSLEVRLVASLLHYLRVGLIVPKHKHSAVDRNKLKRRLREITRCNVLPTFGEMSADLVIRAGPEAYRASFDRLRTEVTTAVSGLIKGGRPL